MLEFRHVLIHPAYDLIVVFVRDLCIVHVPAGQFLRQDLIENIVFVIGNGFVDTAFAKSAGRDYFPVPKF